MLAVNRVERKISAMENVPGDATSLDALHGHSAELIMHARRLQQEFVQLREASKLLRKESLQLREDCRTLRNSRRGIL
jgi:hypothetical protein